MLDRNINIKFLYSVDDIYAYVGSNYLSKLSYDLLNGSISSVIKYFIVEYPYIDKDFRSLYYKDLSKRHQKIDRNCYRIHFMGYQDEHYGFITLRNTPPFNLGRSYINPCAFEIPSGYFLLTNFEVNLLGERYEVSAFPWMQQDANISRCAQVAIWSISRYYSERYNVYAEHTVQDIYDNATLETRKIPSKGLTINSIAQIFSSIGFYPQIYIIDSRTGIDQDLLKEIIYVFIESGIPLVAGLLKKGHAITLMGHLEPNLSNDDGEKFTPVARLINSYFSVDDNLMPYSILGQNDPYSLDDISTVIVPLYEKMYFDIKTLLKRTLPQFEHEKLFPDSHYYRRVFMTSSRSFKYFAIHNICDEKYKSLIVTRHLPKFIWIVEYIIKEHYPNHVYATLVFDATAMEYNVDLSELIFARIGQKLFGFGNTILLEESYEPIYVNNLKKERCHEMD